jgi:hypothetical protein
MRRVVLMAVGLALICCAHASFAGGTSPAHALYPPQPPLDPVLMGFKDQGVWYFPCVAPVNLYRVPPHYLTFAPPPPPCDPVPAYVLPKRGRGQ